VTGKGKYSGDILLPGLLHARIVRPPAHGATLKDVDTSAAEKIPGVRVVKDGDLVAVLHARRDVADQALGLVKAQFNAAPAGPDDKTIFDHLLKTGPRRRWWQRATSRWVREPPPAWWNPLTSIATWRTPPWRRTPPRSASKTAK